MYYIYGFWKTRLRIEWPLSYTVLYKIKYFYNYFICGCHWIVGSHLFSGLEIKIWGMLWYQSKTLLWSEYRTSPVFRCQLYLILQSNLDNRTNSVIENAILAKTEFSISRLARLDRFGMNKIFFYDLFTIKWSSLV